MPKRGDCRRGRPRRRGGGALAAVACAMVLNGCGLVLPDRIHYEWDPTAVAPCDGCAPGAPPPNMVAMAMSGGGSRAAVFSAAVMKQLAARGLDERITHISSVSGGGFASSYYVTRPPTRCGGDQACLARYFDDYLAAMRSDYFSATLLNQIVNPNRITSPTRRVVSLQEALDDRYLSGVRFGELPPAPVLLVNAASYDDGRRFVFSNLTFDESRRDSEMLTQNWLRTSSFSMPGCARPTPADMPVSLAVSASAAFPPLLGPVNLQAPRSCQDPTPQYWHLGDGGIYDNAGVDTVRELIERRVAERRLRRALVFVADAGRMRDAEISRSQRDLSVYTNATGAVVEVAQARGAGYSELYWRRKSRTLGVPIDTISFRYTDTRVRDWPDSCDFGGRRGAEIARHIADIPTDLEITECDADLIEAAAAEIVPRRLAEHRAALRRHGLAPGQPLAALN